MPLFYGADVCFLPRKDGLTWGMRSPEIQVLVKVHREAIYQILGTHHRTPWEVLLSETYLPSPDAHLHRIVRCHFSRSHDLPSTTDMQKTRVAFEGKTSIRLVQAFQTPLCSAKRCRGTDSVGL